MKNEAHSISVSEKHFRQIIENSPYGIVILDHGDNIVYENNKVSELLGQHNKHSIIDKSLRTYIHPSYLKYFNDWLEKIKHSHSAIRIEMVLLNNNNNSIAVEMSGNRINDDGKTLIQIFINDITERKQVEAQFQYNALTDEVFTKLEEYKFLNECIQQVIEATEKTKYHIVIMYLDLDHYKFIKDTYGFKIAHSLLEAVAQRLKTIANQNEIILPLSGDRFVIIIPEITKIGLVTHHIQKFLNIFSQPFFIKNQELLTTATAGISLFPENGLDSKMLLRNADLAHTYAKKHGQDNYQFFTPTMSKEIKEEVNLLYELKQALNKNELTLVYQPIIDINTGKIEKLEVFLRWYRAEKEILLPNDFLALAEETDLIFQIGEWVIKTACRQSLTWQANSINSYPLSLNLSPRQFQSNSHLINNLKSIIKQTNIDPRLLEFEMSEDVSILNIGSDILQKLKELRIKLTIDNFGASFFSLSELKRYQIDNIKIDRSLVSQILSKNDDRANIVTAIIAIGEKLNINVIAEGVETENQLLFLQKNACRYAQGNYICPPLKADEITPILNGSKLFPSTNH